MFRNQFLIGSADTLSCFQRSSCEGIGRFQTAHNFHDDIHFRIVDDRLKIMNQDFLYRISREISQIQHIFDVDLIPCFSVDTFMVGIYYLYHS